MEKCDYCKRKCLPFEYAGSKNICRDCLYQKFVEATNRRFLAARQIELGGEE